MKKAALTFFRYDLPQWNGKVYSVAVDGAANAMSGAEINKFITTTRAPVALALMMLNLRRDQVLPVGYMGKTLQITRG